MDSKPPRRRPNRARPHLVNVRLSDAELARVTAAAEARGLTVAGFAFEAITLTQPPAGTRRKPRDTGLLTKNLCALGRIGGNVNQIARALNRGRDMPPQWIDAAALKVMDGVDALLETLGRTPPPRGPKP